MKPKPRTSLNILISLLPQNNILTPFLRYQPSSLDSDRVIWPQSLSDLRRATKAPLIMSSAGETPDFKPFTIPYTGSGAVQQGGHYVPSSKTVGGVVRDTSEFPTSVRLSSVKGVSPQSGAYVETPTASQAVSHPCRSAGRSGTMGDVISAPSNPTLGPCTTPCEFTGATTASLRDVPHQRFQPTPQFPSSYVGLRQSVISSPPSGSSKLT